MGERSKAARPVVVELVGPAGSGKSALAQRLSAQPGAVRASVWNLPRPLIFEGALRSLPALVGLCWGTRSVSWPILAQVMRLGALRLLLRRRLRHTRLVVLDEGPVFALSWVCVFGPAALGNGRTERWWRRRAAEWAPLLDRVVLLDTPDPILMGRLRGRSKRDDELRDFTDREIVDLAAAYRAAFAHVLRHLAPGDRVVTLPTDDASLDRLVGAVGTVLDETHRGD